MDSEWNNESNKPQKPNPEDIGGSGIGNDLNLHFDSETNTMESSSSDPLSKNSDPIVPAFNLFGPEESFRALPSSPTSSSSATSSSDDLFQVIPSALIKQSTDFDSSSRLDDHSLASSKSASDGPDYDFSGPTSASSISDVANDSVVHTLAATQSPPIQVMDRSGGYEPYRIPSSVFARSKASAPVEWSIASNDSLFSIHLGNSSFSRDHFMFELPKSSEMIPLDPQPLEEEEAEVVVPDNETDELEHIFNSNQRSVGFVQVKDDGQIKEKPVTSNNPMGVINSSRHSDESGASAQSFTFPILAELDRHDRIKIETQVYRLQWQYQQPYVQKPKYAPASKSSSKRCCGSCCSCRSCCCSCRSCWSCFSCSSCRSCCSCSCFYSSCSCRRCSHCCYGCC